MFYKIILEKCKICNKTSLLWICSHLLKKFLMENFIFCAVKYAGIQVFSDPYFPYTRTFLIRAFYLYAKIRLRESLIFRHILRSAQLFNLFVPNALFLYRLKTSENLFLMFSEGRKRLHWEQMG